MLKRHLFVLLALIPAAVYGAAKPLTVVPALSAVGTPTPAPVVPPRKPLNLQARYSFDWNSVPLGSIALEFKEDASTYHAHVVIKSKGLVSAFAKHKSDTVLDGKRTEDHYYATLYETNYQTRNKPKHIRIDSDGAGHIVKELSEPPDGPDRPKVKQESKEKATDPLTTVFLIRAQLAKILAEKVNDFDLDMYDGRRLCKLHFTMVGKEDREINDRKRATIHLVAKRTPVEGFTPKELDRMKTDPEMNIYFSDDDALIPLLMEVSWYGKLRGVISDD